MKADIKARWITALTSGHYRQATGALNRRDEHEGPAFCCLGVLCDLWRQNHPGNEWHEFERMEGAVAEGPLRTEGTRHRLASIMGQEAFLPCDVMEWAGLDTNDGTYTDEGGEAFNLAELNDDGSTFEEIAGIIEREF